MAALVPTVSNVSEQAQNVSHKKVWHQCQAFYCKPGNLCLASAICCGHSKAYQTPTWKSRHSCIYTQQQDTPPTHPYAYDTPCTLKSGAIVSSHFPFPCPLAASCCSESSQALQQKHGATRGAMTAATGSSMMPQQLNTRKCASLAMPTCTMHASKMV